jgi:hypothetical protein
LTARATPTQLGGTPPRGPQWLPIKGCAGGEGAERQRSGAALADGAARRLRSGARACGGRAAGWLAP